MKEKFKIFLVDRLILKTMTEKPETNLARQNVPPSSIRLADTSRQICRCDYFCDKLAE